MRRLDEIPESIERTFQEDMLCEWDDWSRETAVQKMIEEEFLNEKYIQELEIDLINIERTRYGSDIDTYIS